jgi:hypothetical protein
LEKWYTVDKMGVAKTGWNRRTKLK